MGVAVLHRMRTKLHLDCVTVIQHGRSDIGTKGRQKLKRGIGNGR